MKPLNWQRATDDMEIIRLKGGFQLCCTNGLDEKGQDETQLQILDGEGREITLPEVYDTNTKAKEAARGHLKGHRYQIETEPAPDADNELTHSFRGALLCRVLKLRKDPDAQGRYLTEWGNKTPLGIFLTAKRIIEEGK